MSVSFAAYDAALAIVQSVADQDDVAAVVYDGPQPAPPTNKQFVILGCDDANIQAGQRTTAIDTGEQSWLDIGAFAKREVFVIRGVYVVWHGDTDFDRLRAKASTFFIALEAAVLPHSELGATLSGPNGALGHSGLANLALGRWMYAHQDGAGLHVQFGIACDTYPTN